MKKYRITVLDKNAGEIITWKEFDSLKNATDTFELVVESVNRTNVQVTLETA